MVSWTTGEVIAILVEAFSWTTGAVMATSSARQSMFQVASAYTLPAHLRLSFHERSVMPRRAWAD
ncbi:MAG: hypothetical protein GX440_05690 [Propionibacterium sp.]|nr:hypothetical protein [Propionibacterium sp.]